MLQSTFDRLADWIPVDRQWVVAGDPLIPDIREQVPYLREDRIVVEPVARNTAAAIGAAAAVDRVDRSGRGAAHPAVRPLDPGSRMVP